MKTSMPELAVSKPHRGLRQAVLFLFTFGFSLMTGFAVQAQTVEQSLTAYGANDEIVVKVHFTDIGVAQRIAKTWEPRESKYDLGYLILQEQRSEIERLLQLKDQLGITVTIDEDATATERLKLQGLAPQKKSPGLNQIDPAASSRIEAQQSAALSFVGIPGFACYRTVEETYATAEDIVLNYPNLASWTDVGDSWEKTNSFGGYDMNVLRLTNLSIPGPKPTIFITSSIHAREYTTAELMTRFAELLVAEYGVDADTTWILDHTDVRLMLVANPDGRKQAETGILWRKNTNQNYCGATSNSRSADLNRNFTYEWSCCNGSSGNQCSNTYRGSFAGSEPETQAVINQLSSIFPDARGPNVNDPAPLDTSGMYLDIHSSGRLLLWPWGFTSNPAPNGTQLQTLGRKLAFFNGHTPQQSIGLYPTDGTTTSYGYGELGLASYTYELGTEFFESCSYFENTLLPDNIPSLRYALKVVRAPYQLPAGPEGYGISLSPTATSGVPAGTDVTLQVTFNDGRYNNSNGSEPTQNIAAVEYTIDQPPWEAGASPQIMSAADLSFDSSVEVAQAVIDTSALAEGRHTVFTRAQDAAGNWGTVTAVFLDIDNNATLPTILFDDNFETDLGWQVNPNATDTASTGQWERADPQPTTSGITMQLGDTVSGSFDLVTGPLAGSSAGTNDIDAGVTSIRSPDIAIPAGASNVELSLYSYLAHQTNGSADDFLRVTVVGSSSPNQVALQETGAANEDAASWVQSTIALNGFVGETIYLLIEAADAAGGSLVEAAVDDVRVSAVVPAGGNQAPAVDAGTPIALDFPAAAALNGSVTDDGLPDPPSAVSTSWSQVSGPGTVSFANSSATATSATFSASGVYTLRLSADDGELQAADEVVVSVNGAPAAAAGADLTITLPASAALNASVSDDGLPNPPAALTTNWTAVSGPGTVSFADAGAVDTTASFSAAGTYLLRITADDGSQSVSDDVQVTVNPPPNTAPSVSAGGDISVGLPAAAALNGSVSDDGLPNPPGTVTTGWSQISGPGTVTFGDAAAVATSASFSSAGTYVLRLSADDGEFTVSDDVQVIASNTPPPNDPPVVGAGADQTITLPAATALAGSVSDDGQPNPPGTTTSNWTVVSGPGSVTFGDASVTATSASFSAAGVYLLRLTADDSALSASDDVQITVNPAAGICPVGSIDFNSFGLESYSNQDLSGGAAASADGTEVTLTGNAWKRSLQSYNLTPNSVLKFEYASSNQGEIHGIGFDADQTLNDAARLFQFWGDQNWTGGGAIDYSPKYSGGGAFQAYSIPVGASYSGSGFRLVLVNDKDTGSADNNGTYRCVRLEEEVPVACETEQNFESGLGGWSNSAASSCSTGSYVLGTPTVVNNGGVVTQLAGDHTSGSGSALFSAFNTTAGSDDIDGGTCIAESPVYNVTAGSDLSIWYFHGQRDAGDDSGDFFDLELSLDGGTNWTSLASNGDQTLDAAWTEATAAVPAGSAVKIRISAADGTADGDLIEAGVDDLRICAIP